jgi:hypothetical protein
MQNVAKQWLSWIRDQMGLPSLGSSKPDISSDSENDFPDDSDLGRTVPSEMSETTKQIANKWLQSIKGNPEQGSVGAANAGNGNVLDISDDSGTDEDHERPVVALSAQTEAIAKRWLSALQSHYGRGPRPRSRFGNLSDDDSSSDNDQNDAMIQISQSATRIALLWLNGVRRISSNEQARRAQLSSDDSSSDVESNTQRHSVSLGRNIPLPTELSTSTKQIMAKWIAKIRN